MNTMNRPTEMLLTTGGLGYWHPASGTWGSMPTVVVAGVLIAAGLGPGTDLAWVYFLVLSLILIVYSAACVLMGHEAEAKWGKDPSQVVADETAGQAITLMMIPAAWTTQWPALLSILLGAFLFFRAFDILKPWPAGAMQSIAGGWGILLDDIFAGLMAGVLLLIAAAVL
jgi:phosphatidylglycerophosphatase A